MKVNQKLQENQARVEQLTKDWTEKWKEAKSIMQVCGEGLVRFVGSFLALIAR